MLLMIEICLSLDTGNIKIPIENSELFYFEWDTNFNNYFEGGKTMKL